MQITPTTLQTLRAEINEALVALGKKYGLELRTGAASYSELAATFKLEVRQGTFEGKKAILDEAAEEFKVLAPRYGAEPSWLNRSFRHGNFMFKVIGLAPGRSKNCIKILRNDEKGMVCSPEFVRARLGA